MPDRIPAYRIQNIFTLPGECNEIPLAYMDYFIIFPGTQRLHLDSDYQGRRFRVYSTVHTTVSCAQVSYILFMCVNTMEVLYIVFRR